MKQPLRSFPMGDWDLGLNALLALDGKEDTPSYIGLHVCKFFNPRVFLSTPMSLPPNILFELLQTENTVVYNTIAASGLFFWEYCITFAEEIDLIWRWKWSPVTVLFIIIRYLSFAIRVIELLFYGNLTGLIKPSVAACQKWVKLEVIVGHCLSSCVELLLAVRTHALYGRNRIMLALLIAITLAGQGASISILVRILPNFVTFPLPIPSNLHVGACVVIAADPDFPNYLVPALVTETTFFLLVLIKFIHTKITAKTHTSHLLIVFLRDGIWAYALVFGVLVWTIVTYKITPAKGDIAVTWLFTALPFAGTRLVINLRSEAPSRKNQDGMEMQIISPVSQTLSPMTLSFNSPYEQQQSFGGVTVTRSKVIVDDSYLPFESK